MYAWMVIPIALLVGFYCLPGEIYMWAHVEKDFNFYWLIPLLLVVVAHELIHALAFLVQGVGMSNIIIGFDKANLSPQCETLVPISVAVFKKSLAAPFIVLTPIICAWYLDTQDFGSAAVLAFSVSGCAHDMAAFYSLRKLGSTMLVYPYISLDAEKIAVAVPSSTVGYIK